MQGSVGVSRDRRQGIALGTSWLEGTEVRMGTPAVPVLAGRAQRWVQLLVLLLVGMAAAQADTFVGPPVIVGATTATAVQGQFFTYQIVATNSPTSFSASNLPSGLSANTSTGAITGAPTATGNTLITIGAANTDGTTSAARDL